MTWSLVYHHDKQGNPLTGQRAQLVQAVANGAPVRVMIEYDEPSPAIYREVAALWIKNDHVYAQFTIIVSATFWTDYHHCQATVSAPDYEPEGLRFMDDPYWYFESASTHGDVDKSRWGIGDHKLRRRDQGKFALRWFVQR